MKQTRAERRKRLERQRTLKLVALIVSIVIVIAGIIWISTFISNNKPQIPTDATLPATEAITEAPTESPTEPPTEDPFTYVTKTSADVRKGYQILVNEQYEYIFPENAKSLLVDAKAVRNNAGARNEYQFNSTEKVFDPEGVVYLNQMLMDFYDLYEDNSIKIISTFRTLETQVELFETRLKKNKGDYNRTKLLTAVPGHSEHHTGLSVDFSLYYKAKSDGEDFMGQGIYGWINENSWRYGFIWRYQTEKTQFTGISNEPWHFRYVRIPHAQIMKNNNLCLEEYIDWMRQYTANGNHLSFTAADGDVYEIYYVEAMENGDTPVPVLKSCNENYSISGNNVDGFIVTCKLSSATAE